MYDKDENLDEKGEGIDEETKELMKDYDLDEDEAEHVKEIMDETGLDADDAVELKDEPVKLTNISAPTAGGGVGVLEATSEGWNNTKKYFQYSN